MLLLVVDVVLHFDFPRVRRATYGKWLFAYTRWLICLKLIIYIFIHHEMVAADTIENKHEIIQVNTRTHTHIHKKLHRYP